MYTYQLQFLIVLVFSVVLCNYEVVPVLLSSFVSIDYSTKVFFGSSSVKA